jgi:hypothetical protein
MLTIFTAPKPFSGHIGTIQRNAIRSWKELGPEIQILLVGDEPGMEAAADALGVRQCPGAARNAVGTPLVSSIFDIAHRAAEFSSLCYVNADIVLTRELLDAFQIIQQQFESFVIVGQRWDLEVRDTLEYHNGWHEALAERVRLEGQFHPPAGSDYFVFPSGVYDSIPPFALGRAGWDNWMIFEARRAGIPVIDASKTVLVVHQNHDYGHLPGGNTHYRLPESQANLNLGGGRATVFTLEDANWELLPEGVTKRNWRSRGLLRSLEAQLIAAVGAGMLASTIASLFHPVKAFRRFRGLLTGGLRARLSR